MPKHSKNYHNAAAKIEPQPYPLAKAIELAKDSSYVKFDQTLEIAMRLGVDPKHAEQMVRGTVVLLKKTARLKKGSGKPNRNKMSKVTQAQIEEIARTKLPDLNASTLTATTKIIASTTRSMGIEIQG